VNWQILVALELSVVSGHTQIASLSRDPSDSEALEMEWKS